MPLFSFTRKIKAKREAAKRAQLHQALRSTRDACKAAYNDARDRGDTRSINATWGPYEAAQRACLEAGA